MAERQYELSNPNGRIKGAGYGGGRGKNTKRTDFTGIDGVEYTGANGDGGLDIRRFKGANGNGGLDGQSWRGANGGGGLDGLSEMQKKNQRIRGAGFKGERASADSEASGGEAKPSVGGPLAVILGALGTIAKKLDSIDRGSRRISR